MKKNILLAFIFLLASVSFSFAQDKADKYCRVTIIPKSGFTNKRVASIYFGTEKSLFIVKDSVAMEKLKKVNNLTSEVDVLNYMSQLGWTPIDIHAAGLYTAQEVIYSKNGEIAPSLLVSDILR